MFTRWLYKNKLVGKSKHAASKKGHKHQHNLSKGQMKDYQKRMDANQKWFN